MNLCWSKKADNASWITNSDLNMRFKVDARILENKLVFLKNTPYCIKLFVVRLLHFRDNPVNYGTIPKPQQFVFMRPVFGRTI